MESARPVPALTDDAMREIFLRIGSPADLARTAAACVAFRRLIADPSFLRRYRSLHPPPLLGLLEPDGYGFHSAEAPYPSAPLARAVARAAGFFFHDYLPRVTGDPWLLFSVRGGLAVFRRILEEEERVFPVDFAVCDPFARRCLVLPPIPDDPLASIQVRKRSLRTFDALVVPSGADEEDDDTSFRVIARLDYVEMVVVFIFSSTTGRWSDTPIVWDALSMPVNELSMSSPSSNYAYGCFYWKALSNKNAWLKFDMSSMEFSAVDLPLGHVGSRGVIITEAGEGRVGMFGLTDDGTSLCYSIGQIGGERPDQLKMDSIIPLPIGFLYYNIGEIQEGHIFIMGHGPDMTGNVCFALEIKTMKIQIVCLTRFHDVYPYFGFLPSMPPRRI